MFLLFSAFIVFAALTVISAIIAVAYYMIKGKPWGFWSFTCGTTIVFASLVLLFQIIGLFNTPMQVSADDIYGEYTIDRDMFPGENADWQYETYRMEITEDNELKLYQMEGSRIVATHEVPIRMRENYRNTRLKLEPQGKPRHHMLRHSPLMVRSPWSFYYVFYSPHYGNMYFTKKGSWLF